MSFLSQLFAKRSSAPVARDRLQILLAHERAEGAAGGEGQGELIAKLREEILEVIARHVPIDRDKVQIKLDRGAGVSTLEIDVEMPVLKKAKAEAVAADKNRTGAAVKDAAAKDATGTAGTGKADAGTDAAGKAAAGTAAVKAVDGEGAATKPDTAAKPDAVVGGTGAASKIAS